MCHKVQIYHYSCQMKGIHKRFLCDEPDFSVPADIARYQELDEYPMPDFCPSCFLTGGMFDNSLVEPYQRSLILESEIYKKFATAKELAYSEKVWKRAESDPHNMGSRKYFVNRRPPQGSSKATQAFLVWLLGHLKVSFWYQVLEKHESPSMFRRQLIIQLQDYQVVNYLEHCGDIYDLRQRAKGCRPDILKGMVEHPSITTLSSEDRDCNICLEHLGVPNEEGVTESLVKTDCNHPFGDQCLYSWIKNHESCPLCRHTLLTFAESENRYLEEAKAARESTGYPDWLVNLSGLDIATIKVIVEEIIIVDTLHLSLQGILPRDQERSPAAYAYRNFGFLQE